MGTVCADPAASALTDRFGATAVVAAVRTVLDETRAQLRSDPNRVPTIAELLAACAARLEARARATLVPVINATGVVIHTNLGRAPLAPEAVAAMEATAGYGNLELNLDTGRRASRHDHLDALIAELSGAEAGLAVNNCAGAVLLALAAVADRAPVIVSRGELVEIGGGFRVPDVVAQSGSRLVEVGATNRTHLRDYEQALREHPDAKVILRTHPSNFRMTGFTSSPSLDALARFAHAHGLLLIEDLGGGALIDLGPYGIPDEPTVQASLRAGVDLVLFSGDKLLGGPQAGIAAGSRDLVERLGRHPLARALRLGKPSVAALAATLRLYRAPVDPTQRIPVLRMLTEPLAAIAARAEALTSRIADVPALEAAVEETQGYAGGGAMPMLPLPGRAVALRSRRFSPDDLARRLRNGATPVLGRIERDLLLLELRTVSDAELPALAAAIAQAA
ncbi:MAG: L-seryl-tRNA(Sec) selenium transferase [Phenylobacterium sp.]|nr:L-seryl-tRNA(Sec) selenium transferase [Phenylobacterium sp.]